MRKLALLLLLAEFAPPMLSANRVTVEQVDQLLAASHGKGDGHVAGEISGMELTERASQATLLRWQTEFPGRRTQQALTILADTSAFLDPPAKEIPAAPAPDMQTQTLILSRAIDYVARTIPKLPDFFASRNTTYFEDATSEESLGPQYTAPSFAERSSHSVQQMQTGPQFEFQPLHVVSASSAIVAYRDGREVDEPAKKRGKPESSALVLTTGGEFGPVLSLVLADAMRSEVVWSHWEQGANGREAVFHYQIPEEKSHYMVEFQTKKGAVRQYPAYHGELAVDPANGSILRLTVVSQVKPPNQMVAAAIAVDYAPVVIGGDTYICPVKSVALSKVPILNDPGKSQTQLNDISFTQYHVFRAQSQILSAENAGPGAGSSAPEPPAALSAGGAPVPAPLDSAPPDSAPEHGAPGAAAAPTPASPPFPPSSAPVPPTSPAAAQVEAPPQPASAAAESAPASRPAPGIVVLQANSTLVLLDVVVTDHGKAVHGLERGRFHIFENGQEQTISSFEEHEPEAPATPAPAALPAHTYSNVPVHAQTGVVNVLLLDTLNTPQDDQMEVQRQVLAYFGTAPPGVPMAVFALSSQLRMVQGFTTISSLLTRAVQSAEAAPHQSVLLDGENNSSQSEAGVQMARASGPEGMGGMLAQSAVETGTRQTDARARMTLQALRQIARYLSGIPGRKNLIWLSGSFPVSLGSRSLNSNYASEIRETSDLLSRARVAVYPVGAGGLTAQPSSDASYVARANLAQGPPAAFMQQTTAGQASMNELARQTGGRAYVNANGLKEAVAQAVENGSSYYAIGYSPTDANFDGRVRTIHVRIDHAHYTLAYRSEYYADAPGRPSAYGRATLHPAAAATLPGAPPATQILFQARVLPESDPLLRGAKFDGPAGDLSASLKGPVQRYIVDFTIDPNGLRLEELPDGGRRAEIDFSLIAYDSAGRRINSLDRGTRLDMNAQQYAQVAASGLPFRLAIDLPREQITLRAAVYDRNSGRLGSLAIPLTIAAK